MDPPLLHAKGVSKEFGGTQALDDVELALRGGEIHALVGGNGSGKSTLLKILAGVYTADAGTLEISGEQWDLSGWDPKAARLHGLRFVHQQPTIFRELSVAENLSIGRGFDTDPTGRIRWRATRGDAAQILKQFQIPARPRDRVSELSPASHTMLEIARALHDHGDQHASVLVLDEPTAALPPEEVAMLMGMLRRYAESGHAIVLVSHRLDEVLEVADRFTVLRDGKGVADVERDGLTHERLVELIVGRPVTAYFPEPKPTDETKPMLEITGLRGGSVKELDLHASPGEIVGIAGLIGSGRSTLLRLLFGAQRPESGTIVLDGEELHLRTPRDAIRAGIAYIPEDRSENALLPGLSVRENMSINSLPSYWRGGRINRRAERNDVGEAIAQYGIQTASDGASIETLSGGNQQKLVLARWLRGEPRLLLLDEPTQGVDVGARAELWKLILDAGQAGAAVLVVSSDFEELIHLCTRLVLMRDGRPVAELSDDEMDPDRVNQMLHEVEMAV
jgi:ribose transport system ATP-binding protein